MKKSSRKLCAVFFGIAAIATSCNDRPKIDYQQAVDTTAIAGDDRLNDSTKLVIAELPVRFDSTEHLLFGISLVDLQERGGYSKMSLSSYDDYSSSGAYQHEDYLSGYFINIVFQDRAGNERKLTENKLLIRSVTFLREIFRQTKSGYLLYTVSDRDSNRDNELTHSDLEALYISQANGTNFRKLSKELHEFYDWTAIRGDNRIYFRTLEDRNKDGELNNRDTFHYYRIDFDNGDYTLTEYYPVREFTARGD